MSDTVFETCFKNEVKIEEGDQFPPGKVKCPDLNDVRAPVADAAKQFAKAEQLPAFKLDRTQIQGKYAIANWVSAGKTGQMVLVNDGARWLVVSSSLGKVSHRDLIARNVPSSVLFNLNSSLTGSIIR